MISFQFFQQPIHVIPPVDPQQVLLHLNAVEGGPLPRDTFAGLGLHVLQHSAGGHGKDAVHLAAVVFTTWAVWPL